MSAIGDVLMDVAKIIAEREAEIARLSKENADLRATIKRDQKVKADLATMNNDFTVTKPAEFFSGAKDTTILGCELKCTCGACPEQYDVYLKDRQIGYLRLRHGVFRADYPDCGGGTVYLAHPKGDGVFEPEEREKYLTAAVTSLLLEDSKQKVWA